MNFIEKPKETFNKVRFLDYYMEGHSGFIAGGCFKNIFKKERVKDLDIFFENENEFNKANEFLKDKTIFFLMKILKLSAIKTKTPILELS